MCVLRSLKDPSNNSTIRLASFGNRTDCPVETRSRSPPGAATLLCLAPGAMRAAHHGEHVVVVVVLSDCETQRGIPPRGQSLCAVCALAPPPPPPISPCSRQPPLHLMLMKRDQHGYRYSSLRLASSAGPPHLRGRLLPRTPHTLACPSATQPVAFNQVSAVTGYSILLSIPSDGPIHEPEQATTACSLRPLEPLYRVPRRPGDTHADAENAGHAVGLTPRERQRILQYNAFS
ncbi:hypothetical protein LY76DRAFT_8296 [Colletotrichum caudatum]|nr:hypothetical protein LY76DRAFT_8296 [Colletotrichum caudatum]